MTETVTLTKAEIAALVQAAVAAAIPAKKARGAVKGKGGAKPLTDEQKAERRSKADAETIKAFTKAGYKDVQPRVNVLTYGKIRDDGSLSGWLAVGRRVKKGEKAIKVGSFPLFHVDQTEEFAKKAEGTVH